MGKQFGVIGLGDWRGPVAETLYSPGHVLTHGEDEGMVQAIADGVTHLDAGDEWALNAPGICNFDIAVVSIGTYNQASFIATMQWKEADIGHILCKGQSALRGKVLQKIGADRVMLLEKDMEMRVTPNLSSPNLPCAKGLTEKQQIIEINDWTHWEGKSLWKLKTPDKYGFNSPPLRLVLGNLERRVLTYAN